MFNARPLIRNTRGMYSGASGVNAIINTAHSSLQGFLWLLNPVGSGIKVAPLRIDLRYGATAATVALTSPRITIERITFTGVSSATPIALLPRRSAEPAALTVLAAGSTGITPTTVSSNGVMFASLPPIILTAVGVIETSPDAWLPGTEDGMQILLPGEGMVIRQPDNGTASDPRVFVASLVIEEFS